MVYTPYDPADSILFDIDMEKMLSTLSEQDRAIFQWWVIDKYTKSEIMDKLKKQYGVKLKKQYRAKRKKYKTRRRKHGVNRGMDLKLMSKRIINIINKLRSQVGNKDLYYIRIKKNRKKKAKNVKKPVKKVKKSKRKRKFKK